MKKAVRNRGGAGRGETVKRQRLSVEREIAEAMRKVEPLSGNSRERDVNAISTAGLTASNSAYEALTDDFKQSTDELTQLQSNINTYVNFISTASSVVAGLASEIPLVAMT
ncbi:hypothetical protein SAMN05444168_4843 [Paraburkholderia phenazinium]|uniref:Uncharacterized protein n=2 Tax=Burkholderiaceae TaxID=119060 RepID=A0A1N6JR03_9BURK|nr:hypothetical protein SAMN05444168_4843 [Paraburkholderia phenazinium]